MPGVSDLDLVAIVDGPVDDDLLTALVRLHTDLDAGAAAGLDLGCVHVEAGRLADPAALHPTWTHGRLVHRILSGVTRAELVRFGRPLLGRQPSEVLPPMTPDDLRAAARAELTGYWATTVARPWWFLDPALADLALTSMARGRHTLASGELLTKTAAAQRVRAPRRLADAVRRRRRGAEVTSPRLPLALVAWLDVRRTVALARRRQR